MFATEDPIKQFQIQILLASWQQITGVFRKLILLKAACFILEPKGLWEDKLVWQNSSTEIIASS